MYKSLILTCLALMACAHQRRDENIEFTLLHTNDSHGHIENFSSLISKVKEIKEKNENVLLLDAGDTFSDTLESMHDQGETVATLMKEVGYDAIVPGNHDFDYGVNRILALNHSGLPVIAANLVYKNSDKLVLPPYLILTTGALRIGVIGLTYPKTPFTTEKHNVDNVKFSSELEEVIDASINRLKEEKVDIIILLTHLGLSKDIEMARNISGIDLIVGGHSHNKISNTLRINNTVILQAGAHLQNFGKAVFVFSNGKLILKEYELVDLNYLTNAKKYKKLRKEVKANKILARSSEAIPRADTEAEDFPHKRMTQSLADSMFADLLLKHYKSDGVILPGVGYGLPLPKGNITLSDLRNLIPHDAKLYRIWLTGSEILELIEQSLENVLTKDLNERIGGLIQIAGMEFTFYPEMPKGKRVSSLKINRRSYKSKTTYEIITVGLLAEGGHFNKTMKVAEKKEILEEIYPDLIIKLLEEKREISSPRDMRIIEIPILKPIKANQGQKH